MYEESVGYPIGLLVIELVLLAVVIVGLWKLFQKAGKPGWAAIIPIYNTCILIDIAGKPIWWILLMFIPFVNLVVGILVMVGLAQNFGRGTGTVIGLIFLPMLFLLILGFGSAEYKQAEAPVL
jgi:hypothetical protein